MKRKITILIIILSAFLLVGLQLMAQPIIALGSTRGFIRHNMAKDSLYSLSDKCSTALQYKCPQKGITVLYRFSLDEQNTRSKTCTDIVIDFNNDWAMEHYIDNKIMDCKLKPTDNALSFVLVTDLFDEAICFTTVGKRRLIIKYCEQ